MGSARFGPSLVATLTAWIALVGWFMNMKMDW